MLLGTEDENIQDTKPEEENQPPTTEEQLKTLLSEIENLKAENTRLDGGYKGLQRTLSERDKELRKQADLDSRINGLQDTIEILATAVATGGSIEDVDPSQRKDVLVELRKQREQQEAKRKVEQSQTEQQAYAQRADAVFSEATELLKDSDDPESLIEIKDFLMDGKIERAEARLGKLKGGKGSTSKKESEEQRIERLTQERLNKVLEERGLLEDFTNTPSSGTNNAHKAMQDYIDGKISADEAKKRGAEFM